MPVRLDWTTGRCTHVGDRLVVEVHVQKNVGSVGHITAIVVNSCDVSHSVYLFGQAPFNCTQFPKNAFSVPVGAILPRPEAGRTP